MARPKVGQGSRGTRGNTDFDHAWVEEHLAELEPIDPDADGNTPYGARMLWTGDPDDQGSPWQIAPEDGRCTGRAYVRDDNGDKILDKQGKLITRPCSKWPILGGHVCIAHGGGTENAKRAAKLRLLSAADKVAGQLIAIALDRDQETAERIKAINSILDRAGIKGTDEITEALRPWELLLKQWMRRDGADEEDSE